MPFFKKQLILFAKIIINKINVKANLRVIFQLIMQSFTQLCLSIHTMLYVKDLQEA